MNPADRDRAFKLLFALTLLLAPAAAQARPQVAVDFNIEATKYRRNLYKQLGAVEHALEAALAGIGNEKFGFLDWKPAHSAPNRSAVSATLRVRMVDGDPGELGPSIWLQLSARPEAAKIFDCGDKRHVAAMFDRIGAVQIFSGSEPQSGVASDLQKRVGRVLRHHFENGGFGQIFAGAFLNRIPIGDRVVPFPGPFRKHIAIGIAKEELQIDPRTGLALAPCAHLPGESSQTAGTIGLELAKTRNFDPSIKSLVQVKAVSCNFYPWEDEACIQSIPLILQHGLSLEVFMRQYVRVFPGTDGQRATAP